MILKAIKRNGLALLLGVFTALLGVACGGKGSDPPPAPPPSITTFTSDPANGFGGQPCTLTWSVSGATRISIDNGVGDVTGLSTKLVYPQLTTTYKLTASNSSGDRTASTTVTINASIVIPTTTKVADTAATQGLTNVSANGSVITFTAGSAMLQDLKPGDRLVMGVSSRAPDGLLRKVTSVNQSGSQVTVNTTSATLEEVINKCDLAASKVLTPADVAQAVALTPGVSFEPRGSGTSRPQTALTAADFYVELNDVVVYDDGNLNTDNDQIKLNGSVTFTPTFNWVLKVDGGILKEMTFTETLTNKVNIEASAKLAKSIDKKKELARYNCKPIVVWVGWVPVIFRPVITLNVGLNGEIYAGIKSSITEESSLTLGMSYLNGGFSPIANYTHNFSWEPPQLTVGCSFKAFAGPQLSVLVYGLAGPYAEVRGYLNLEADVLATPWWELYGGLEAVVGIRVQNYEWLQKILNITDYEFPAAVGVRILIAQATAPPAQNGTVSGSVMNAVTNTGLSGVTVKVLQGATIVGSTSTTANGGYSASVPAGTGYRVEFAKSGFLTANYSNVAVQANHPTYLEVVLQVDNAHAGNGTVGGTIVNALNGNAIGSVSVKLRSGMNATSGNVVASTTTNGSGGYAISNLPAGNYTAELGASGFSTNYMSLVCLGGTSTGNQNGTLTPILAAGETRIILTWGASPADLDSHLTGPLATGSGRFHVYYSNNSYSAGGVSYADLDLDDTTSYGPETTTIRQQTSGSYRFSVHDFTNRSSNSSTALSLSGAKVLVYRGSNLVATFFVPSGQPGTLWTVFELNEGTVTPINQMSFHSSSDDIPIQGPDREDDAAVIAASTAFAKIQ